MPAKVVERGPHICVRLLSWGLRDHLREAAKAAHRSMNSEIVARLTASFEQAGAAPAALVDDGDDAPDTTMAALRSNCDQTEGAADFGPVVNPGRLVSDLAPARGLDVDRLDRLTAIVDRTRLAMGQAAARQLWSMLGLPALRTSSPRAATEERGPDLLSLLDAPPGAKLGRTVKDCVADFIVERCERDPLAEVKAADFRLAYERWAKARGLPTARPSVIGKYAAGLGVVGRKSFGTIYVGLRLKEEAAPPAPKPRRRARL